MDTKSLGDAGVSFTDGYLSLLHSICWLTLEAPRENPVGIEVLDPE